jgi:DNA polymerase IV
MNRCSSTRCSPKAGVTGNADGGRPPRSRTLPAIVTSQETLRTVSVGLVRTVFPPAKGIRLVGVTLSSFEMAGRIASEQLELGLGMP